MDRTRAVILALAVCGCEAEIGPGGSGVSGPNDPRLSPNGGARRAGPWDELLDSRRLDYSLALRTAALKLVGDLPSLDEIRRLQAAIDRPTAYAEQIDRYLADRRFHASLIDFFRDAFRTGGTGRDSAATFAAMVVVQ